MDSTFKQYKIILAMFCTIEELKALVGRRSRLKAIITRILDWSERTQTTSTTEVAARMDHLQSVWKEFNGIGDSIALLEDVDGYVDPEVDQKQASLSLTAMAPWLAANQSSSNLSMPARNKVAASGLTSGNNTTAFVHGGELLKIQIKRFAGLYTEWPAFQDIYESTIHNKRELTNTQKFHHLNALLIDDAANLVRHLAITDTAYNTAWERLKERYNRPRHIVNSFLEKFMGLPTTNKIDVSILRKVSDGTNEIVRGLDAINQTGRDCWIQYLVLEKLDADTRRRWIERSMGIQ
ncbi:uncharacterized protein LOC124461519 [Drosophila willistoni]|uniref:uncharacterized protein LOC124461519 n=1 Tax=Drosophila willistoni TaxID=7260 RepID=UPI001F075446|nr:uncharacterized protein LOC124461519 [Drosophila willistoni]